MINIITYLNFLNDKIKSQSDHDPNDLSIISTIKSKADDFENNYGPALDSSSLNWVVTQAFVDYIDGDMGEKNLRDILREVKNYGFDLNEHNELVGMSNSRILSEITKDDMDCILNNYILNNLDWKHKSHDGVSNIQTIINEKKWDTLYYLIKSDINLIYNIEDQHKIDAYLIAASNMDVELMDRLTVKGVKVTSHNYKDKSVLEVYFSRSEEINPEILNKIIDNIYKENENYDITNHQAINELFKRISNSESLDEKDKCMKCLKILMDRGFNLNKIDDVGNNSLNQAIIQGVSIDVIKMISESMDRNHVNKNGETSLDIAIKEKDYEIADYLKKNGFVSNEVNHNEARDTEFSLELFNYAINGEWNKVEEIINSNQPFMKKTLINALNGEHDNHSLLIYAVKQSNIDAIKMLVNNGADLNLSNSHKMSPFFYACINLNENKNPVTKEIFDYFLQSDVQLDIKSRSSKFAHDYLKNDNVKYERYNLIQSINTIFPHRKISDKVRKSIEETKDGFYQQIIDKIGTEILTEDEKAHLIEYDNNQNKKELQESIKNGNNIIKKEFGENFLTYARDSFVIAGVASFSISSTLLTPVTIVGISLYFMQKYFTYSDEEKLDVKNSIIHNYNNIVSKNFTSLAQKTNNLVTKGIDNTRKLLGSIISMISLRENENSLENSNDKQEFSIKNEAHKLILVNLLREVILNKEVFDIKKMSLGEDINYNKMYNFIKELNLISDGGIDSLKESDIKGLAEKLNIDSTPNLNNIRSYIKETKELTSLDSSTDNKFKDKLSDKDVKLKVK